MGTTREEVINVALDALGEPRSVGTDDDSSWVVRIRNAYQGRVRFYLEDYPWNFATELTQLSVSSPTPEDWDYGFNKPADWMRTIHVSNCAELESHRLRHDDRQGRILANTDTVWLWWVSQRWVDDELEGSWPQHFADVISAALAYAVCPVTSEADGKRDRLKAELKETYYKGKTWDAQQKPSREPDLGRWADARRGGLRTPRGGSWRG